MKKASKEKVSKKKYKSPKIIASNVYIHTSLRNLDNMLLADFTAPN